MKRRILAALLAAGLLGFAPAPFLKGPADGLDGLDGLWEALTLERSTGVATTYKGTSFARFEGDKLTFVKDANATAGVSYKIAVDDKARPSTLDLLRTGGPPPKGPPPPKGGIPAVQFKGLYKIEGGRLYFIYSYSGAPARPTGFKPAAANQALMTFKRIGDPLKGGRK